MANPQINISSLDFSSIKQSLKDYISTLNEFKDYDFEGSAINSLLDVLAYNTLYYAFYSNMIANESFLDTAKLENNIISLLTPFGYIINGNNSSRITCNIRSSNQITPFVTKFRATNNFGSFDFYAIDNYNLNSTTKTNVTLFQARSIVNTTIPGSQIVNADQKYFLGNTDIDINSLRVFVDGEQWQLYDPNTSSKLNLSKKLYFIERENNGFYLLFGKKTIQDITGFDGLSITTANSVNIKYLIPSGEEANGCVLSSLSGFIITDSFSSSGGGTSDLESIKKYVPKLFAASDRAVTKDDYIAILLKRVIEDGIVTNENQINVWGGDELRNPILGRVFYTINDTTLLPEAVSQITSYLREKSVMTVTPEYVPSTFLSLNVFYNYVGSVPRDILQNAIRTYYSSFEFNKSLNTAQLISTLSSSYAITNLTITRITTDLVFDYNNTILEIGNKLLLNSEVRSQNFSYNGQTVYITNSSSTQVGVYKNIIDMYDSNNLLIKTNVGNIDYENGIIKLLFTPEQNNSVTVTLNLDLTNISATRQYILLVNPITTRIG